jgi:hypothetical protein
VPLEAEGALTVTDTIAASLNNDERIILKTVRRVLAVTANPKTLTEDWQSVREDGRAVLARLQRGAFTRRIHPALADALQRGLYAISYVVVQNDLKESAKQRAEALNFLRELKKKKTAETQAPQPQEPRVDRKLLEEYRQNFKEAQLSLDLRRPMNDRGWVQQKQPTKPMKIITGPDDRVFRLAIRDVDREDIEQRDADAIRDWADGYRPPCPITKYVVHDDGPRSFNVQGFVQNKEGDWKPVGRLFAYLNEFDDGTKAFVSESADVPIPTLAACPGLGNGMYLAAANEACSRRSRLAGSGTRSVFSEHFWKKQIEKKRAYCSGNEASIYYSPSEKLRNALLDGEITVPQYNAMRGRLPRYPGNGWDCENVVLNDKWCKTPKKDRTLRGVGGRGRYRIVSGKGR